MKPTDDVFPFPENGMSTTPRTDAAYFKQGATMYDLAGESKKLETELATEREKVRVLRVAMVFIMKCGGMNIVTDLGEILCNGSWCAEQARAALAATKEGA